MQAPRLMNTRGYVDAHVHLRDAAGLEEIAAAGVVAVRDAGSKDGAGLRTVPQSGMAAIVSAGWCLYKTGGYGSCFGVPVGSLEEIKSEIVRLKHAGAAIIKVMASGMVSLKNPGSITPGGFDRAELLFIVHEAARQGLGVMAHANGESAILACAEAGVRSIEHGFFMTERPLELMAAGKIFWVPTVGALARAAKAPGTTDEAREFVRSRIEAHLGMILTAWKKGVPLAIGTDCVLPDPEYKKTYASELEYFKRAGIPYDGVISIASEGGARLLGLSANAPPSSRPSP